MELLAPVKNYENAILAINLQADAIYCSGPAFSARTKASISFEDLEKIVKYAHLYQKKVYITLNTIIDNHQIDNLLNYIQTLATLKIDAIIVQDLGVLYLINKYFPNLEVHASTQMHLHNLYGALFAKNHRIKRVVLARELSYQQIKIIKDSSNLEIETFIHGALCTSYSGQCYYSWYEKTGSGNRGSCQQHCRNLYSLEPQKQGYLLSLKDLASLENINLLEGISDSLKIEGRLKNSEYLYATIKYYRQLIDMRVSNEEYLDLMRISFNREYTKGYLFNEDEFNISNSKRINNTGLFVGKVIAANKKEITIQLVKPLYRLDVIRIVVGEVEYGIKVDWIKQDNDKKDNVKVGQVKINNSSDKIIKGDVFVVKSERIKNEIKHYSQEYLNKITKDISLDIQINQSIKAYVDNMIIESKFIFKKAKNQPLEKEDILKQLTKTNQTPYEFNINFLQFEPGFINRANLNEFRREIIFQLMNKSANSDKNIAFKNELTLQDNNYIKYKYMIRNLEQAQALIDNNIDEVYVCKLSLLPLLKDKFKKIIPVLNRVYHDDEFMDISQQIQDYDTVMVSELGMLEFLKDIKNIETNFSLNIANKYGLVLLKDMNVTLAITSLETKAFAIEGIASGKIIYGRIPLMITKNNIINSEQDYLFDYKNNKLPILKDNNGLNELYSAQPIDLIDNNLNGYGFINFTFENYLETKQLLKRLLSR